MEETPFAEEPGRNENLSQAEWARRFGSPVFELVSETEFLQAGWSVIALDGHPASIAVGYSTPTGRVHVSEVEVHTLKLGVAGFADQSIEDAAARLRQDFIDVYLANRPGSIEPNSAVGAWQPHILTIDGEPHAAIRAESGGVTVTATQIENLQLLVVGVLPLSATSTVKSSAIADDSRSLF